MTTSEEQPQPGDKEDTLRQWLMAQVLGEGDHDFLPKTNRKKLAKSFNRSVSFCEVDTSGAGNPKHLLVNVSVDVRDDIEQSLTCQGKVQ